MLRAVSDEGHAIHYTAVERGTPVFSSDGTEVGKVHQVVDNYREHILDGIVLETTKGDLRFVDAPEVARTAEQRVTLAITEAETAHLREPEEGAGSFRANVRTGRLGRLLGGGWKKDG
jgi:sporulation protein YlmC with PRC-barrel domain